MKQKIHYLFMLLLMLLTGVGGVKAQNEITVSKTTFTSASGSVDDYIKYEGLKGTASTAAACYSNELRIYQNGGILKVSVWKEGAKIKSVTVGSSSATKVAYSVDDGEESSSQSISKNGSITVAELNCETVSFICKGTDSKSRLNVNNLSVSYVKDATPADPRTPVSLSFPDETWSVTLGGGGLYPNLSVDPAAAASEVEYSSSDENVAVVGNNGAVSTKAVGTTTITASIKDSETYKDATASYVLTVNPAPVVVGIPFYESFNTNSGTGGNDGSWSGSIATSDFQSDYVGWKQENASGAKECIKAGSGSKAGKLTTPELPFETGKNYVITFKAAAWNSSSEKTSLSLSSTAGALSQTSVTTKKGEWTNYSVNLTSVTGPGTITFYAPNSSNNRFFLDEVKIEEAPAAAVEVPTFSVSAGTYYEPQTVELSCETEGATIYYTLDGSEPTAQSTEYTGAISISETTTLKAIAVKDGQSSNVVSATYTIPTTYATIAAFKKSNTPACLNLTGAQVVYIDEAKKNIYVRDASAAICLYNRAGFTFEEGKELKAGDILSGTIYGKYALYNNLPEVTDIQDFDKLTVTGNNAVTPKNVSSADEIAANMCDLVKITKTQITESDNKFYVLGVQLYDKLKLGYTPEIGVDASITGVVTDFNNTTEIFPRTLDDIAYYPAAPTFSPEAGTFTAAQDVTISTTTDGAEIYYTTDGSEPTTSSSKYSAAIPVNSSTTIKAIAVKNELSSSVAEATYTIEIPEPAVDPGTPAAITAGFYTIKNLGNNQFVNVAGRKTATLVDNAEGMAGTVIQVESDADGIVKTLRSQGVDVPGYATRAMKYVPDVVKLVVEKLHVSGSGEILGETGVDKILDKFNKSVDVNLHVVHADGGYRIYGKTPSMTPVKEFYQENKANVDAKLPGLEKAINDAIATIVDKVGKGESLKNTFKLETIWKRMGWTDYEPGTEETTQVAFLQQVLANEENIWNFAYQTAMFYMEWVEGKQAFQEMQDKAPELMKYWNLAKKVRPNFMYYIVQKDGKVDVISQGNEAILNNDKSTVWALEEVSEFKVNLTTFVEKTVYPTSKDGETISYKEYYGTLYTDFAYKLPEGVTAYKVTGINKVGDKAYVKKAELNSEVVPAQTPVLLIANTRELTLTIAEGGEAVADNQLYGNDYLINEYDINTPQLEFVFNYLAELSQSTYDKYEYLMRKNAGTVNNKYFFGIAVEGELNKAYKDKTGKEMESSPVLKLGLTDGKVGFFESWNYLAGNEGFMFSEEESEILMNIVGDVNRDGTITISDVTALVNIILGKATYPADADKYDFEAADVNTDKTITIADVTALVNIILGK